MTIAAKSKVLHLEALTDYQAGAIVSHQITKAGGGNVTLFAFDEGQELSEHSAAFDVLVEILAGEAEIKISGIPYILIQGDAIVMPANIPHAVLARKKFKMLLTMIKDA
jgi:quercetin dioxygenase-like cupin family protein